MFVNIAKTICNIVLKYDTAEDLAEYSRSVEPNNHYCFSQR
jgi:hypothetical protein